MDGGDYDDGAIRIKRCTCWWVCFFLMVDSGSSMDDDDAIRVKRCG